MSVTLTSAPPAYSFSQNDIRAKFTLSDIYDTAGAYAVNRLPLPSLIGEGTTFTLTYGGKTIVMTAATAPDESGEQFPRRTEDLVIPNSFIAAAFRTNFVLQNDFIITDDVNGLVLTAKNKGLGYDIENYNTTPGSIELIKPNLSVRFILYCENANNDGFYQVYNSPLTVLYGNTATAEGIINDKLHTYISAEIRNNFPDVPGADLLLCKKSCRRYYFEFAESYGEIEKVRLLHRSATYTVLHGGFSTIGQATKNLADLLQVGNLKRFLKQGSTINSTRTNQLQYLYLFNAGDTFQCNLRCRLRFTDGEKALVTLKPLELLTGRKYGMTVNYNAVFNHDDHPGKTLLAYDVWLESADFKKLSEVQTYVMDYRPLEFIRYFLNWSSWGTMDSRMFYGKGSVEFDMVQSEAEKSKINYSDIRFGTSLVFDIKISTKFTVTTGFIKDRRSLLFNRDFFISPLKYRVVGTQLLPLKVTSKTIPEISDGDNLLAQKFEYEYLFEDSSYTEGDIQEPGLVLQQDQISDGYKFLTDNERVFILTPQKEYITLKL